MAANVALAVFTNTGGTKVVTTGNVLTGYHLLIPPLGIAAGSALELDLPLPPDARIERALFEVIADPVAVAKLAGIADVRAGTPTASAFTAAAIVDFGRLVTLGGILGDGVFDTELGVSNVQRWTGTGWAALSSGPAFPETATERLLVQSTGAKDSGGALADRLTGTGAVALPATPPALELLVEGRTIWFERQGSSPSQVDAPHQPATDAGVRYVVERTDAVREAFDRAVAASADPAAPAVVRVGLRAAAPGGLRLTPQVSILRVHTQQFPPLGLTQNFDLPEEGVVQVELTPPRAREVHEVDLVCRGTFGPQRVQPPVGPPAGEAAVVVLVAGRSRLVGLPRSLLARFATIFGVRLRLAAPGSGGGQVTGQLLSALPDGRPGDPVDGGALTPVTVTDARSTWHTLSFPDGVALDLPPDPLAPGVGPLAPGGSPGPGIDPAGLPEERHVGAWLELQTGYGEVTCDLTPATPYDVAAPGAPVWRRLSGGATSELSRIPAVGPLRAAVRVAGLPDRDHPIAAVALEVAGAPGDLLDVDPASSDLRVRLTLRTPVPATPPVLLRATCAATGSLTLDSVQVVYRELEGSP